MSLYNRTISDIEVRRERILSGKINCIPWGLPRFEEGSGIPGIEQGNYYLLTASSKIGKTQITDWLFVYNALRQAKQLGVKLKIFYFTLEMSKEEKMRQAMCNHLYIKHGIRIPPVDLRSTRFTKPVEKKIIELVKQEEEYFLELEEKVTFIDSIRNPTGINKFMRSYALNNGTQHMKTIDMNGEKKEVDDYYEPNDPEEYVIVLIDHISLIQTERLKGVELNLRESIGKLSSDYLIRLRNKYNYIPVVVQQQAAAQESNENMKYGKLKPTTDGLGDNKTTFRDANVIMGLFSPYRHRIKMYPEVGGYDIMRFRDRIRFLEVIGGRQGGAGVIAPLYFDGAVNYFQELPKPDSSELKQFYNLATSY